ncbi:hypothetical protein PMZ80_008515 [Knufia obscura]|uniref:Uncharacterized protein n=2 Tax=Knufia TaxID=430999 RepID=A0AAN8F5R8_9EURO|nr:hypothetical protein PMZ80_008515 [Knufia obscura]KAK5951971.1 hypothetical protein OHC33_006857 [Knufia fluminis]
MADLQSPAGSQTKGTFTNALCLLPEEVLNTPKRVLNRPLFTTSIKLQVKHGNHIPVSLYPTNSYQRLESKITQSKQPSQAAKPKQITALKLNNSSIMRVSGFLALLSGASVLATAIPVDEQKRDPVMIQYRPPTEDEKELTNAEVAEAYDRPIAGAGFKRDAPTREQKRDPVFIEYRPPTEDEKELTDAEVAEAYDRPIAGAGF